MATQKSVTLIADIHANSNCSESAFTTKLARPFNLLGQWRVSVINISYSHQWTTIYKDLTYAILFSTIHTNSEYDYYSILDQKQPLGLKSSSVITLKPKQLPEPQYNLFDDVIEINFVDKAARYEVLKETISESEYSDPSLIVRQIKNTITALYQIRFPDAAANKCDDIVTYNPITRRVTFKNLVRSRYLIASPSDASIISMLGYGDRSVKIQASREREIDILPVETDNSANSRYRLRNPLPHVEKVNLLTLDNVFVYTNIIEQLLIGKSYANLLGYFQIKSNFGETGYWCFNPPYDYKVIKNIIDTISIKLTRMNGELLPFKNGTIIIRLLFKQVL